MQCSNSRCVSAIGPVGAPPPSTNIRSASRASRAPPTGLDNLRLPHQAPPRGLGRALVCRAQKLAGGVFEAAVPEELREKVGADDAAVFHGFVCLGFMCDCAPPISPMQIGIHLRCILDNHAPAWTTGIPETSNGRRRRYRRLGAARIPLPGP